MPKIETERVVMIVERTFGYQLQLQRVDDGEIEVIGRFPTYHEADAYEESFRSTSAGGMYDDCQPVLIGRLSSYLPLNRGKFVDLPEGGRWDSDTKTGICRVVTNQQVEREFVGDVSVEEGEVVDCITGSRPVCVARIVVTGGSGG